MFSAELLENATFPQTASYDPVELTFELGTWLSGIECFLHASDHAPAGRERRGRDAAHDWTKEFRLTHAALLNCAKLTYRLGKVLTESSSPPAQKTRALTGDFLGTGSDAVGLSDWEDLGLLLRETIILSRGLIRAEPLLFEEWKSWSALLADRLRSAPVFEKFTVAAERSGEIYLPEDLLKLTRNTNLGQDPRDDLNMILPRFGRILRSLSIVGRMLRNDEPLKPTLLIFAHVRQQTTELIGYINNRLERFPDESADLFGSLDGASYTAALELKKVYQDELAGLAAVRPAPSVYARIETAYALLNDSFQQILAGFARLVEPKLPVMDLFPNFKVKLEQSLALRSSLWRVLQAVQTAEQTPDKNSLQVVRKELSAFMNEPIGFLFYKDKETLERFSEEILAGGEKKDIVPILHRFGAYLETLFGQVNMRNVLANHPFDSQS